MIASLLLWPSPLTCLFSACLLQRIMPGDLKLPWIFQDESLYTIFNRIFIKAFVQCKVTAMGSGFQNVDLTSQKSMIQRCPGSAFYHCDKHHNQWKLGKEKIYAIWFIRQGVRAGAWRLEPGTRNWSRSPEGLLVTGFSWLTQLAVYTTQDHLPRHVSTHSVQAPSMSIISQSLSDGGIFSAEDPSSQMTVACSKLSKPNKHKLRVLFPIRIWCWNSGKQLRSGNSCSRLLLVPQVGTKWAEDTQLEGCSNHFKFPCYFNICVCGGL